MIFPQIEILKKKVGIIYILSASVGPMKWWKTLVAEVEDNDGIPRT